MGVYRPSVLPSQYKVMNETFLNTATTEMYDAVSFYTSSGYTAITKALLAGEIKGYETIVDSIQEAVQLNPPALFNSLFRGTKQNRVKSFKEGDEVHFPQFLSVTTCPVVASGFAHPDNPAVIVFNNITHPFAAVSDPGNDEKEILLGCSSRFIVTGVSTEDFCPEYDHTGYYGRVVENATVVHMTMI